jgi:hypothetical protein
MPVPAKSAISHGMMTKITLPPPGFAFARVDVHTDVTVSHHDAAFRGGASASEVKSGCLRNTYGNRVGGMSIFLFETSLAGCSTSCNVLDEFSG